MNIKHKLVATGAAVVALGLVGCGGVAKTTSAPVYNAAAQQKLEAQRMTYPQLVPGLVIDASTLAYGPVPIQNALITWAQAKLNAAQGGYNENVWCLFDSATTADYICSTIHSSTRYTVHSDGTVYQDTP